MKLKVLKDKVYGLWLSLHQATQTVYTASSAIADSAFKQEIKRVCQQMNASSDLRLKATWELVFAVIKARLLWENTLDCQDLIEKDFISYPQKFGWQPLVSAVLNQFLAIEGAIEVIQAGLQKIRRDGSAVEPQAWQDFLSRSPIVRTLWMQETRLEERSTLQLLIGA